jgi:CubicO group peptidase (beta-lactamase class C family)
VAMSHTRSAVASPHRTLVCSGVLPWSESIGPVVDQHGFSGVVSMDRGGTTEFARAYGLADRACQIPNTVAARFAIASGTKGLTALTAVSLINDEVLGMSTTARSGAGHRSPAHR